MVDTRPADNRSSGTIRPDPGGGYAPAGRSVDGPIDAGTGGRSSRQKIPTARQMAELVVDGLLTLPRNYRRGMFLDVLA